MNESHNPEINPHIQTPLARIEPIEKGRNAMFRNRDEIKEYVEPPLVDACENFWDLNVRTLNSSANSKDIGHQAYIIIDYNSLSEDNKKIALESGVLDENYDGRPVVNIGIPVNESTVAEEIKTKAIEISRKFQKQKATWIPSWTLQDMKQWYGIEPEDDRFGIDAFREEGFYYDSESNKFYASEEHSQKAKTT